MTLPDSLCSSHINKSSAYHGIYIAVRLDYILVVHPTQSSWWENKIPSTNCVTGITVLDIWDRNLPSLSCKISVFFLYCFVLFPFFSRQVYLFSWIWRRSASWCMRPVKDQISPPKCTFLNVYMIIQRKNNNGLKCNFVSRYDRNFRKINTTLCEGDKKNVTNLALPWSVIISSLCAFLLSPSQKCGMYRVIWNKQFNF